MLFPAHQFAPETALHEVRGADVGQERREIRVDELSVGERFAQRTHHAPELLLRREVVAAVVEQDDVAPGQRLHLGEELRDLLDGPFQRDLAPGVCVPDLLEAETGAIAVPAALVDREDRRITEAAALDQSTQRAIDYTNSGSNSCSASHRSASSRVSHWATVW